MHLEVASGCLFTNVCKHTRCSTRSVLRYTTHDPGDFVGGDARPRCRCRQVQDLPACQGRRAYPRHLSGSVYGRQRLLPADLLRDGDAVLEVVGLGYVIRDLSKGGCSGRYEKERKE